eukprot:TRINITY_DN1531_c0_g2_i1.p2 TRINITY_DN1531_c0_g2~~TRINITY_DN1531_c0_g2_i1.p2  ORF type:complete len:219 (-),score=45.83 TRINITY_DN1531_c0_g2_i1:860-1516(-)
MDIRYWSEFYKKGDVPSNCSTFASSILPLVAKNLPLFEVGCGNGRDALFFAEHEIDTTAVDICEVSIQKLKNSHPRGNPSFFCEDFTNLPEDFNNNKHYGTVYSRFTLHSVKEEAASRTLRWAFDNLIDEGKLFIEVRSIKDPMCGKGTPVEGERDAFINTHYRRFVRADELTAELESIGFHIDFFQEADGLSIWKDDNPVVIRIHARKSKSEATAAY